MSANTTAVVGFVGELFKTPAGQIRLLGAIMCIGPGYYLVTSGAGANNFVYVMMGIGTMFILLSAGMAIWSAIRASGDQRKRVRDEFPVSDRLRDFSIEVLKESHSRQEITEMTFSGYDNLKKDQLYSILMQATANECVMAGVASRIERQYKNIQNGDKI